VAEHSPSNIGEALSLRVGGDPNLLAKGGDHQCLQGNQAGLN